VSEAGAGEPRASIRFGLGRSTTENDVDFAAERVTTIVTRLRLNRQSLIPNP
jgi:cysteine sulfinate desulfinase/cysteine desulfurase-like protein